MELLGDPPFGGGEDDVDEADDPDADSDDSDMGFYMPSIISKDKSSPPKPKPQKITKKIRVKK